MLWSECIINYFTLKKNALNYRVTLHFLCHSSYNIYPIISTEMYLNSTHLFSNCKHTYHCLHIYDDLIITSCISLVKSIIFSLYYRCSVYLSPSALYDLGELDTINHSLDSILKFILSIKAYVSFLGQMLVYTIPFHQFSRIYSSNPTLSESNSLFSTIE